MFWFQIGLSFLAGMFFTMFMSTFVSLGYRVIMIKSAQRNSLEMLKVASDSINSMLETQRGKLSGEEHALFEKSYNVMREVSVLKLRESIPSNFKNLARYSNWTEAMVFLDKERENDRQ